MTHTTETEGVLQYVLPYCIGRGIDVGCGQHKITPNAIGLDFATQYDEPTHPATAADLIGPWETTLNRIAALPVDYVYSSHLLEDYPDICPPLRAWLNALRPGGHLILVLPIEQAFLEHCSKTGQPTNPGHAQDWTSASNFVDQLPPWFLRQIQLRFSVNNVGPSKYSFVAVFRKATGPGP